MRRRAVVHELAASTTVSASRSPAAVRTLLTVRAAASQLEHLRPLEDLDAAGPERGGDAGGEGVRLHVPVFANQESGGDLR